MGTNAQRPAAAAAAAAAAAVLCWRVQISGPSCVTQASRCWNYLPCKQANPSPLGLYAFALTTALLMVGVHSTGSR